MRNLRTSLFVAASLASLGCLTADAQPLPAKFRGAYVCGTLPTTRGILRTSLDLIVDGGNAWFARPLFNQNGTLVVGSEIGFGTIDGDGQLRLTSQWSYLGDAAAGDYRGTIAAAGGTLTGTQTWTRAGTPPVSRACVLAVVPAPNSSAANPEQ
jgi:hypothetical protein